MKQIIILIICVFIGQFSFAQSDSVYLSNNAKIIGHVQIITPFGDQYIRESYTFFKYRYWINKVDTASLATLGQEDSKKNKKIYYRYGNCDSIVNEVRNSSQYWNNISEIENIARMEIGFGNIVFKKYLDVNSKELRNFSEQCSPNYNVEISTFQKEYLEEIQRIKLSKLARYEQLVLNSKSIEVRFISEFLESFDVCETDYKSLELIIIESPESFVRVIDKLSDSEFYNFTINLDSFPINSRILEMKTSLKNVKVGSSRKAQIIRKIKQKKV